MKSLNYGAYGDVIGEEGGVIKTGPGFDSSMPEVFGGAYGIRRDTTTGLDYMRFRWYAKDLSSFISADRVRGTNRYNYAKGNPVKYVDPMGKFKISINNAEFYTENISAGSSYLPSNYFYEVSNSYSQENYFKSFHFRKINLPSNTSNTNCLGSVLKGVTIPGAISVSSKNIATFKSNYTRINNRISFQTGDVIFINPGHFAMIVNVISSEGQYETWVYETNGDGDVYQSNIITFAVDSSIIGNTNLAAWFDYRRQYELYRFHGSAIYNFGKESSSMNPSEPFLHFIMEDLNSINYRIVLPEHLKHLKCKNNCE